MWREPAIKTMFSLSQFPTSSAPIISKFLEKRFQAVFDFVFVTKCCELW
ncbi:hypothetical protein M153_3704000803 [Pseudoloma neurophilia]|uniref:Uncharacterized protein n=1 Tax=Pseudoloma neurophilia TaxID=146866 RepID=A0A0R0M0X1_9MICR|nr:hypothetical protein M153_3704000803 [Pseudoloma neurophilia]